MAARDGLNMRSQRNLTGSGIANGEQQRCRSRHTAYGSSDPQEAAVLDLNDLRYFVEVVDREGFSAAARSLQRPISTVSYRIKRLERELGLTLLARTSRHLAMTEVGEEFYSHAVSTLERALEAELAMRSRSTEPVGTVRYTLPVAAAQFVMPEIVSAFLARYPKIELVEHACDAHVDIIADRYHFAIRAHSGPLPNSALLQRPLAQAPWHLFAAPEYLHEAGTPETPDDLRRHHTLLMKRDNAAPIWRLRNEVESSHVVELVLKPRLVASMVTLKSAAEARMGIVALPAYICREEQRTGRLQRVLPDWIAADSTISALMPSRRGMSAATRAFIEHIAASLPSALLI